MTEPRARLFFCLTAVLYLALVNTQPARAQLKELFGGGKQSKTVMVYVDLTESIKDADVDKIYTPTLRALVDTLKPGDRMLLAEISEQSLSNFAPAMDVAFPVTGRSVDDQDALEAGQRKLRDQWRKMVSHRGRAKATLIMDSLNAGSQIFARDQRPDKWMVILSDMIEESRAANFAKVPPAAGAAEALILQRRDRGLLPDLRSVKVFVAGASAPSSEKYMDIQNFWLKYIKASGGQISERSYGRVALTEFR